MRCGARRVLLRAPRYGFVLLADCAADAARLYLRDNGYREHPGEENSQNEAMHRYSP